MTLIVRSSDGAVGEEAVVAAGDASGAVASGVGVWQLLSSMGEATKAMERNRDSQLSFIVRFEH
ncbi:hypothetical protein [Leptolyngbya sp. O-77]|uniref:hypothetical protein n=1 Tax=Leptolyngbya sp. O-77 TaxID=1080068 RepID=UPI001CED7AF2|nr:hypothetical protein [Leptolyngbya sp. O-77]